MEDDGVPVAVADPVISMTNAIHVAGCLHVLGNASRQMLTSADHYDEHHKGMHAISQFLSDKLTNNLFVGKCLVGPAAPLKPLFESFSHTLVGWRWEAVWELIQALLDLELPLRWFWDRALILGHGVVAAPHGDRGVGVHFECADSAILNPVFWGYLKMLSTIGVLVEHLFHWVESCPCHSKLQLGEFRSWKASRAAFGRLSDIHAKIKSCPLRGCRAPELAVGAMQAFLLEISRVSTSHILATTAPDLSRDARAMILREFDLIKFSLIQILQMKFAAWEVFPRMLAGLGPRCSEPAVSARLAHVTNQTSPVGCGQIDCIEFGKLLVARGRPLRREQRATYCCACCWCSAMVGHHFRSSRHQFRFASCSTERANHIF